MSPSKMGPQSAIEHFRAEGQPEYDEISLIDCQDSFTHNLVQAFLSLGADVSVFNAHKVKIEDLKENCGGYIVLSPGPGRPEDSGIAMSTYDMFKSQIPILGVCLGFQVINEYWGGRTVQATPMHGKVSLLDHVGKSILTGVPNPTTVARYHSLKITDLSPNIEVIGTVQGQPELIMAYRTAEKTAAVQFHPESFLTTQGSKILENFLERRI